MNASCGKAFSIIDSLAEKYVSLWEDICNIESPTSFKQGVDEVCDYLVDFSKKHGYAVEFCPQSRAGNIAAITLNPDAALAPICLSAHMDTVHPVGSFGSPVVKSDGEKLYGPGVCDCKGGFAVALLIMEALSKIGFSARPVKLILQSDEEVGSSLSSMDTVRFMCEQARGAEAFFNLEGASEGFACIARKGIASFTFTVTGEEAHSSQCAKKGANAIIDAAHKMIMIDKLKDHDGITCNCAVIEGGTVVNTVPGKCSFKVNVRYVNAEQYEYVCKFFAEVASTVHIKGCSCEVKEMGSRIAMELADRNLDLLSKMNGIFKDNGFSELVGVRRNGGSDAAYVTAAGIPCIDSLGVFGGDIHSPSEHAYISSLAESAKRLAAFIICA